MMKQFFVVFALLFNFLVYSQEKKKFTTIPNILKAINPNEKLDFWVLVENQYSKDQILKTKGTVKNYLPQLSGFKLTNDDDGYFYIAYSIGGKTAYITEKEQLRKFIGTLDNGEEAAIIGILEGYFFDEEYKDLAGNYDEDKDHFYVELGKVTSNECPFEKSNFTLTLQKKSSTIISTKNIGKYVEVYNKKCANNPRTQNYKKELEPFVPPKKEPLKKKKSR